MPHELVEGDADALTDCDTLVESVTVPHAVADALGEEDTDIDGDGDTVPVPHELADGDGDALTDGHGLVESVPVAHADTDADADGDRDGD